MTKKLKHTITPTIPPNPRAVACCAMCGNWNKWGNECLRHGQANIWPWFLCDDYSPENSGWDLDPVPIDGLQLEQEMFSTEEVHVTYVDDED